MSSFLTKDFRRLNLYGSTKPVPTPKQTSKSKADGIKHAVFSECKGQGRPRDSQLQQRATKEAVAVTEQPLFIRVPSGDGKHSTDVMVPASQYNDYIKTLSLPQLLEVVKRL